MILLLIFAIKHNGEIAAKLNFGFNVLSTPEAISNVTDAEAFVLLDVLQLIIVILLQKFLVPEEEFWHKNWTEPVGYSLIIPDTTLKRVSSCSSSNRSWPLSNENTGPVFSLKV